MQPKTFWYKAKKREVHKHVFKHAEAVEQEQRDLHEANLCHAKLYSNRHEPGLEGGNRKAYRSGWAGCTENVIQSVIDTATSLIGKNRPQPTLQTDGGDWSEQLLARKLDKFLDHSFRQQKVHHKSSHMFRDACVWGTGGLKLVERKNEIRIERALIDEIVVNEAEVPSGGTPRQMHQVKQVNRDVLCGLFPKFRDQIKNSGNDRRRFADYREVDPNMVVVVESWHLPSAPGAGDGRHTIVVEKATLLDEEWTRDWFPFVFYRWSEPLTGFYGQGLAEALLGFQIRLNQINDFIQRCQDLIAVPRVALDAGSKVNKVQLNNDIGMIIPYVGKSPEFFTAQAVGPEIYQYKEQLKRSAFEFAGVSQMAAQATRPQGIEAGVALRELSDNQSQRFVDNHQRFEEAHVELAEKWLQMAKEMYSRGGKPDYFSDNFIETIDWKKVNTKNFVFSVQAGSILSSTPAGRFQQVTELAQFGVLRPDQVVKLLNLPDLEQENKRLTSSAVHAEWIVEQLLDGELITPDIEDIQGSIEVVQAAYLEAVRQGAPPELQDNMRRYIDEATAELQAAQPPPEPPMTDIVNGEQFAMGEGLPVAGEIPPI